MPLTNRIIHPHLFDLLRPNYWRFTVTLQQRDETMRNEIGGPETDETLNPWTNVPGHENISCNLGRKPAVSEQREALSTYDAKQLQASLNGYYPLITERMRAVIDGTDAYNIRTVVYDSAKLQTALILEVIA